MRNFLLRVVSGALPVMFFREMKRVLMLNKSEERSEKRVVFVHTAVFDVTVGGNAGIFSIQRI